MGNAASTGTRAARAARAPTVARSSATAEATAAKAHHPAAPSAPARDSVRASASLIPESANDDWANLLRGLSDSIESSAWDGPAASKLGADGPHPAARPASVTARLPRAERAQSRAGDGKKAAPNAASTLTQADVIGLFRLRRAAPDAWNAKTLAEKFAVAEEDLENFLRYTRTYLARTDSDGEVRGYYNPNAHPPIERFERE